jgi:hypothetical protein
MNICTREVNGGLPNYVQRNSNLLILNAPVIIELHRCELIQLWIKFFLVFMHNLYLCRENITVETTCQKVSDILLMQ